MISNLSKNINFYIFISIIIIFIYLYPKTNIIAPLFLIFFIVYKYETEEKNKIKEEKKKNKINELDLILNKMKKIEKYTGDTYQIMLKSIEKYLQTKNIEDLRNIIKYYDMLYLSIPEKYEELYYNIKKELIKELEKKLVVYNPSKYSFLPDDYVYNNF